MHPQTFSHRLNCAHAMTLMGVFVAGRLANILILVLGVGLHMGLGPVQINPRPLDQIRQM